MVYMSGIHAEDWAHLHQHWWQLALVVLCLISALLGVGVIAFKLGKKLLVPPKSKNYSRSFKKGFQTIFKNISLQVPNIPSSPTQIELLAKSDLAILDPQQPNVPNALLGLEGCRRAPNHVKETFYHILIEVWLWSFINSEISSKAAMALLVSCLGGGRYFHKLYFTDYVEQYPSLAWKCTWKLSGWTCDPQWINPYQWRATRLVRTGVFAYNY
ncbi:hypothetical protein BDZ45DRAFT_751674 [Acephala macrosclerotiorum]|nr:hypothetical protein BDZ45DRAFT_751674 [Acephala macrosclerotiorum]